jgi:hypothetical protein
VLAAKYGADLIAAATFLPEGLKLESDRGAIYFIEWQYASEWAANPARPATMTKGERAGCFPNNPATARCTRSRP